MPKLAETTGDLLRLILFATPLSPFAQVAVALVQIKSPATGSASVGGLSKAGTRLLYALAAEARCRLIWRSPTSASSVEISAGQPYAVATAASSSA